MDCLHPQRILNQNKFVSLNHRDRVVLYVRCNKCAACQQYNRNVWYFRAFYEFKDCIDNNGFVLFDCLTYSPKFVPKVSKFFQVPKSLDFYCFDYEHLRHFFVRLRRRLRDFNIEDHLRYFASTEYGTKLNGTHRPHIHLLLYCTAKGLDSITLSKAISSCWPYGRTDGIPYKSRTYVLHNTIGNNLSSALRVCQYVSKYVMKDSSFQRKIDSRIDKLLFYKYKECIRPLSEFVSFDDWQKLPIGKLWKKRIIGRLNQFHRQSLHFGESALRDMDILEILSDNLLTIPDQRQIKMRLGLPLYYKRKLFYELVTIDGVKSWQPTELGLKYIENRSLDLLQRLKDRYSLARCQGVSISDIDKLADYVVNFRGRIKADLPEILTKTDKLQLQELVFCYISSSDKEHFKKSFISSEYLGQRNNYLSLSTFDSISIDEFISKYVYFDVDLEKELLAIDAVFNKTAGLKQVLFDNNQDLRQKYKELGLV